MALIADHTIRVGDELPPLTKSISQRQIDCYSGVRPRSIHTDPDWARQKGFRAPLAQGMMSTAYVSEMMVAFLGEGFVQGGRMTVKFIKPVFVGDALTMHGVVRDKQSADAGHTRVAVEFWCENEEGVKTMVGEASGLAAART